MDVVVERCAGIDVHKDMVAVCVRVPGSDGERVAEFAEFSTFTAELLALGLAGRSRRDSGRDGSDRRVLEAGVLGLEDAVSVGCQRPPHAQRPGPQTDMADAEWICRLMEHGLVRASFVPPKPIRDLRDRLGSGKDPDRGTHPRGATARQDPPRRRSEAVQCRL